MGSDRDRWTVVAQSNREIRDERSLLQLSGQADFEFFKDKNCILSELSHRYLLPQIETVKTC